VHLGPTLSFLGAPKIVHCGEHYSLTIEEEASRDGGLKFL